MESPPSLSQSISRVFRVLAREGDAVLTPLGLRFAQIPVFVLLSPGTPMTQKTLAEAAGIEQPSMAQLLARMERDGLIEHAPHPTDARSRTITLADPGDPRISQGNRRLAELQQRATVGLTDQQVQVLTQLLDQVRRNLERGAPDPEHR